MWNENSLIQDFWTWVDSHLQNNMFVVQFVRKEIGIYKWNFMLKRKKLSVVGWFVFMAYQPLYII